MAAALAHFHPPSLAAWQSGGVCGWLQALKGGASQLDLAEQTGLSRHQIGRWLRGDAQPRVPDLLRLVDGCTGRMPDLVGALVSIEQVPAVRERAAAQKEAGRLLHEFPWSPAVLTLLGTSDGASTEALEERLGLPTGTLRATVEAMVRAGLLKEHRGRVRPAQHLTSTARGTDEDRHRAREHWTRVALQRLGQGETDDVVGYNVLCVSRADMQRIRQRYRAFFREVRSMVAASHPTQTAGLLLVHLVEWGSVAD